LCNISCTLSHIHNTYTHQIYFYTIHTWNTYKAQTHTLTYWHTLTITHTSPKNKYLTQYTYAYHNTLSYTRVIYHNNQQHTQTKHNTYPSNIHTQTPHMQSKTHWRRSGHHTTNITPSHKYIYICIYQLPTLTSIQIPLTHKQKTQTKRKKNNLKSGVILVLQPRWVIPPFVTADWRQTHSSTFSF